MMILLFFSFFFLQKKNTHDGAILVFIIYDEDGIGRISFASGVKLFQSIILKLIILLF